MARARPARPPGGRGGGQLFVLDLSRNDLVSDLTAPSRSIGPASGAASSARPWKPPEPSRGGPSWPSMSSGQLSRRRAGRATGEARTGRRGSGSGGRAARFPRCESLAATPDPDDGERRLPRKPFALWEAVRSLPERPWWLSRSGPPSAPPVWRPNGTDRVPSRSRDAGHAEHEGYLWASAFACALVLPALREGGWSLKPRPRGDRGLTTHIVEATSRPESRLLRRSS